MPTLIQPRYLLDLTGTSINNLVLGENHIPAIKLVRSIAPIYGPYFTESLKVYDSTSNALLTRGIDYTCADIIGLPTAQSGKEICAIILLINQSVPGIIIDYQSLGGGYEKQYESIRLLMEALNGDNRPVSWFSVLNAPSSFDSNMHLHKAGDVIGFEYLVAALEQLKNAVLMGDDLSHDAIFTQIDALTSTLNDAIAGNSNASIINALASATAAKAEADSALALINTLNNNCNTLLLNSANILALL